MIDKKKIEQIILKQGCFSKEVNRDIYDENFKIIPKYLWHNLVKYRLDQKKILDVGCGWGYHLIHFGNNSLGVDLNPKHIRFLRSIGLRGKKVNLEDDFGLNKESFNVAWCANILEHMIAPHLLLLRLYELLKKDGIIIIYCPLASLPFLNKIKHFRDYLAQEHINFFTKETLGLTIERAGFRIIDINASLTYSPVINKVFSSFLGYFSPGLTFVAEKVKNFQYPKKRKRYFTPK